MSVLSRLEKIVLNGREPPAEPITNARKNAPTIVGVVVGTGCAALAATLFHRYVTSNELYVTGVAHLTEVAGYTLAFSSAYLVMNRERNTLSGNYSLRSGLYDILKLLGAGSSFSLLTGGISADAINLNLLTSGHDPATSTAIAFSAVAVPNLIVRNLILRFGSYARRQIDSRVAE